MTDSALLWYLNRATGTVLLIVFTLVVLLGILSTFGNAGRRVPRFLTQALHRQLSLLGVALLIAHVVTAVLDTFVDIRWWQAVVPWWGSKYEPLWLSVGTLSLDLMALLLVTSLARSRMGHRSWRAVHVLGYVAWGAAVAHGFFIGTDYQSTWPKLLTLACVVAVGLAALARSVSVLVHRSHTRLERSLR
ncbi:MAG TPA: ferric reductase-like transmembrane domain-containing protein [Marmoricola sp.]|nr:ferric reductase-like transmembrane domain-containing protein [Marmoricola sp.]